MQERHIGTSLRLGIWASVILLCIGLIFAAFEGKSSGSKLSLGDLPRIILGGENDISTGTGFLYAGLIILVLTPLFRVGTATVIFFRQREYRFFTMSLIIFAILVVELAVALT